MEIIQQEIEKKRKLLQSSSTKKYIRRGDLEKLQRQESISSELPKEPSKPTEPLNSTQFPQTKLPSSPPKSHANNTETCPNSSENISSEDLIKRFRKLRHPISIFGETHSMKISRLLKLESIEERSHGQKNDFNQIKQKTEQELETKALYGISSKNTQVSLDKSILDDPAYAASHIDPELIESDPKFLHTLISVFFKRVHKEWQITLEERSDEVKTSQEGKLQTAICSQTREYLKPFYKKLRKCTLELDILSSMTSICILLTQREYQLANDAYLRMSIGTAAWPIGVTAVGIHERSADHRIETGNVAHALNDETTRKWIQSVKRLMTFYQSKYPNSELSKMVG